MATDFSTTFSGLNLPTVNQFLVARANHFIVAGIAVGIGMTQPASLWGYVQAASSGVIYGIAGLVSADIAQGALKYAYDKIFGPEKPVTISSQDLSKFREAYRRFESHPLYKTIMSNPSTLSEQVLIEEDSLLEKMQRGTCGAQTQEVFKIVEDHPYWSPSQILKALKVDDIFHSDIFQTSHDCIGLNKFQRGVAEEIFKRVNENPGGDIAHIPEKVIKEMSPFTRPLGEIKIPKSALDSAETLSNFLFRHFAIDDLSLEPFLYNLTTNSFRFSSSSPIQVYCDVLENLINRPKTPSSHPIKGFAHISTQKQIVLKNGEEKKLGHLIFFQYEPKQELFRFYDINKGFVTCYDKEHFFTELRKVIIDVCGQDSQLRFQIDNHEGHYHCLSDLAWLAQRVIKNASREQIEPIFSKLNHDDKCLIYRMIYRYSVDRNRNDLQWGEHHVFDSMPIFYCAVREAIVEKIKKLKPEEAKNAITNCARLAGIPPIDENDADYWDLGSRLLLGNIPRAADAMSIKMT